MKDYPKRYNSKFNSVKQTRGHILSTGGRQSRTMRLNDSRCVNNFNQNWTRNSQRIDNSYEGNKNKDLSIRNERVSYKRYISPRRNSRKRSRCSNRSTSDSSRRTHSRSPGRNLKSSKRHRWISKRHSSSSSDNQKSNSRSSRRHSFSPHRRSTSKNRHSSSSRKRENSNSRQSPSKHRFNNRKSASAGRRNCTNNSHSSLPRKVESCDCGETSSKRGIYNHQKSSSVYIRDSIDSKYTSQPCEIENFKCVQKHISQKVESFNHLPTNSKTGAIISDKKYILSNKAGNNDIRKTHQSQKINRLDLSQQSFSHHPLRQKNPLVRSTFIHPAVPCDSQYNVYVLPPRIIMAPPAFFTPPFNHGPSGTLVRGIWPAPPQHFPPLNGPRPSLPCFTGPRRMFN